MLKAYGQVKAMKLMQRLNELDAAENLDQISHLPPPRCHELTNNRKGQFSVDLDYPYRLLFIPADDPVPLLENGGIDKSQVSEIEIIEIEDTHQN
ncbi:type II toxin-antitoxin system RelE/ParE family toxin [Maridesulfovibrio bastinii]|uniref:type II toxin-antitoxin system RelE/ParE family toxin n=1 Tax=Maridesulfovibrio bastinii TaxID=47157 RepID=UPI0004254242|nr:hypothetical protein [Maridesulfovibrio bastinii]